MLTLDPASAAFLSKPNVTLCWYVTLSCNLPDLSSTFCVLVIHKFLKLYTGTHEPGPHDVTMTSESLVWYKVDAYDVVQRDTCSLHVIVVTKRFTHS